MYSRIIKIAAQTLVFATPFIAQHALATAAGTLDPAFSTDGMLTTDYSSRLDLAYGVTQQADGKLVVVGKSQSGADSDFALARYNADGSLDNGFGGTGLIRTPIVGTDTMQANAVIQLANGKLVVVGTATIGGNDEFAVTRYTTSGDLDVLFGGTPVPGIQTTAVGAGADRAMAVLERSDHKLMVAGFSNSGGTNSYDFALVRYTVYGILDTTFDVDGKITTDIALGDDRCTSMIQQADGKLLLAGYATVAGAHNFALVRYNGGTGAIDNSFSSDGKVTTSFGGTDEIVNAVLQQADGKLVAVGYTDKNGDYDIAIARYNPSGPLDNSFGNSGKVITNISGNRNDSAVAVIQQWDGKLLVAGTSEGSGNDVVFFLARYNTDGTPDTSFDADGILTTDIGSSFDYAYNMIEQADGHVVVVGTSNNGSDYDFAAVRYLFDDDDGDGVVDTADNCQYVVNADQLNTDLDTEGNACDSDDDNDGVADTLDDFPLNAAASVDTDGDGMPDDWLAGSGCGGATCNGLTLDNDDDNDGTPDVSDPFPLDPFLWSRIDGSQASDYLGASVASIGDLNADGYDEILVGVPKKDVTFPLATKASKDVGAVYVYNGQTGLVMSPVLQGSMAGDQYGLVVAAAGDIDNDGTPDFMVGAPYADGTDPITLKAIKDRGRVYVYSGADFSEIFQVDGEAAGDGFGISLAATGDVNADTFDDILIGAWKADVMSGLVLLKDAGAAYIISGATVTGSASYADKLKGEAAGDYFGYAVAAGSDLDQDAVADLIIGAYKHDTIDPITLKALSDVGSVYLYSSASPYTFITRLDGSVKGDYFGFALSVVDAGDNVYPDLLVATPYADIPGVKILKDAGKVQLFNDASGNALYAINGTQAGALFGYSVCATGNVDALGADDFMVGAPKMDTTVSSVLRKDAGKVFVHSANDGTEIFARDGENASGLMGNAIAGGGDHNNDGNTDIVISTPLYDVSTIVSSKTVILKDAGRVEVFSGKITQ